MKNQFFLFTIMLVGIQFFCFGKTNSLKNGNLKSNPYSEENLARHITGRSYTRDIYLDLDGTPFFIDDYIIKKDTMVKAAAVTKKTLEKESIALLVQPYQATYHKPYASNAPKPKKEYLSLQEFSDSLMMSDNNHEVEADTSLVDTSLDTKKEEGMTQSRAQMIIFFIFCSFMIFFLFSKIPLLWRKNSVKK